jgi:hypothetical protein
VAGGQHQWIVNVKVFFASWEFRNTWPVSIEKSPTGKEHLNINNPLMLAFNTWPVSIEKFPTDKEHLNINNPLMYWFI